mgnify:CR=1 FL=1
MRVVAQIDPSHPRYQKIQELAKMELEEEQIEEEQKQVRE